MTVADVLTLALGAIALGSGLLVVTTRHVVRAGLWLVVTLGAVAGLYLVLTAELLAWAQVLLYVGAVVVLLLFAVMLTRAPIGASDDLDRVRWPGILVGGGAGAALCALLINAFRWYGVSLPPTGTAERIGSDLFRTWVLPFELVSVLLLAALVGAIVVSRPDTGTASRPDRAGASGPETGRAPRPDGDTGSRPDVGTGSRPDVGTEPFRGRR